MALVAVKGVYGNCPTSWAYAAWREAAGRYEARVGPARMDVGERRA